MEAAKGYNCHLDDTEHDLVFVVEPHLIVENFLGELILRQFFVFLAVVFVFKENFMAGIVPFEEVVIRVHIDLEDCVRQEETRQPEHAWRIYLQMVAAWRKPRNECKAQV